MSVARRNRKEAADKALARRTEIACEAIAQGKEANFSQARYLQRRCGRETMVFRSDLLHILLKSALQNASYQKDIHLVACGVCSRIGLHLPIRVPQVTLYKWRLSSRAAVEFRGKYFYCEESCGLTIVW